MIRTFQINFTKVSREDTFCFRKFCVENTWYFTVFTTFLRLCMHLELSNDKDLPYYFIKVSRSQTTCFEEIRMLSITVFAIICELEESIMIH